jgi:hypothetical protein
MSSRVAPSVLMRPTPQNVNHFQHGAATAGGGGAEKLDDLTDVVVTNGAATNIVMDGTDGTMNVNGGTIIVDSGAVAFGALAGEGTSPGDRN